MDYCYEMDPFISYLLNQSESSNVQPSFIPQGPSEPTPQSNSWDTQPRPVSFGTLISAPAKPAPDDIDERMSTHPAAFPTTTQSTSPYLYKKTRNIMGTEDVRNLDSSDFAFVREITKGKEPVVSASRRSTSTNSMVNGSPPTKKLYECPVCHMGEADYAISSARKHQNLSDGHISDVPFGTGQPRHRLIKPKCRWQRPSCLQRHINEHHIYSFKRVDSEEFICWFCPCTWRSGCYSRFETQNKLLKHISTSHSEPSEAHHHFHHACDPLHVDSNAYKISGAQDHVII